MPFGGYKDFAECVRKNGDKGDPKAYCGKIQHAVEEVEAEMSKPPIINFNVVEAEGEIEAWEETENGGLRARIRIIKAGLSKNNRNYRPEALRQAAKEGIFNNLKMFRGHSKNLPIKRREDEFVAFTSDTAFEEESQSLVGYANFVDRPFAEKVRLAKEHIGVSIDALLRGTRQPQRNGRALEDIHSFAQGRSVDFVLFPSAGGAILAWESEGEETVDWAAVEAEAGTLTEEELEKNLPSIWAKAKATVKGTGKTAKRGTESESSDDESDDESSDGEPTKKRRTVKTFFRSQEEVDTYVDEKFDEKMTAYQQEQKLIADKQEAAAKVVREAFSNSGLPERTRARVMRGFEGVTEVDSKEVEKAIADAKEELKAAGAGPRITGMGGSSATSDDKKSQLSPIVAHESVAAHFGRKPVEAGKKEE